MTFFRNFILIAFFLLLSAPSSLGQTVDWEPSVREIVVNYRDSLIRANILIGDNTMEVSDQKRYYWYRQNQINSNIGGYIGNLLHGEYQTVDVHKRLRVLGYFEFGLKTGTWKYWDEKGILLRSMEYEEGLLNGEVKKYTTNGNIEKIDRYKLGVLVIDNPSKFRIRKSSENDTIGNMMEVPDSNLVQ